ncbi:DUF2512 family protein [Desulfurispora thermophila]|uniref:DUF2512 family protein n=1 Tax=Desulfurispora thermophila TaxID=265470 RepID=UPI00035E6850|nr:DUF2512 family protein [Desulfurispora thermophila]
MSRGKKQKRAGRDGRWQHSMRSAGWRVHAGAVLTKFLFFAPALGISLPFFSGLSSGQAVITAALVTLAAYLTADLVVFPRFGHWAALLADAGIALLVVLEMPLVFSVAPVGPAGWLLVCLLTALGEMYFHGYLVRRGVVTIGR